MRSLELINVAEEYLEVWIAGEESQEKIGQGSLNLSIQDEEILRRKHRQDC